MSDMLPLPRNPYPLSQQHVFEIRGGFVDDETRLGLEEMGRGLKSIKKVAKKGVSVAKKAPGAKIATKAASRASRVAMKAPGAKTAVKLAKKVAVTAANAAQYAAKMTGAALAAAAKAVATGAAMPMRLAVAPIIRKRADMLAAKEGVPTASKHRQAASRATIDEFKRSRNPMLKFAGLVFGYVGTGVSGAEAQMCADMGGLTLENAYRLARAQTQIAGYDEMGVDAATISALATAAVGVITAEGKRMIADYTKKIAAEGVARAKALAEKKARELAERAKAEAIEAAKRKLAPKPAAEAMEDEGAPEDMDAPSAQSEIETAPAPEEVEESDAVEGRL